MGWSLQPHSFFPLGDFFFFTDPPRSPLFPRQLLLGSFPTTNSLLPFCLFPTIARPFVYKVPLIHLPPGKAFLLFSTFIAVFCPLHRLITPFPSCTPPSELATDPPLLFDKTSDHPKKAHPRALSLEFSVPSEPRPITVSIQTFLRFCFSPMENS